MLEQFIHHSSLLFYSAFFLSSLFFSLVINSLFLRFFRTLGIRNNADGTIIRWGTLSKPAIGGLSFYIIFLLSLASYSIFFEPGQQSYQMGFVGIILACGAGFIIGLADDAYNTRPRLKFMVQLMCGLILSFTGIRIELFDQAILNYALTMFWVVGIMNSINMLDNMDGITATVSIGIVLNTVFRIIHHGDLSNIHLLVLVGVLASLIGFLYFNWHPSKMYMGDTGSQFLGVFLSAMGILYFWNDPYSPSTDPSTAKRLSSTLMTFLLPILDTTIVVINRLLAGRSPFIGGKDHTTHSLAMLGLTDRQVAFTFLVLALISIGLNLMIESMAPAWTHGHTLIFGGYFLALLTFFFFTTRTKKSKA
jgi:UDP-GlcNAc:undecaprenyl-phosphate GlcNAc-1-phosphate transferase